MASAINILHRFIALVHELADHFDHTAAFER